jgi:hypothetical protein
LKQRRPISLVHLGCASIPDTPENPASVSIQGIPHIPGHQSKKYPIVPLAADPRKDNPS